MRLMPVLCFVALLGAGCLRTPEALDVPRDAADAADGDTTGRDVPVVPDVADGQDGQDPGVDVADEGPADAVDAVDAQPPRDEGGDGADAEDGVADGTDGGSDAPDAADGGDGGGTDDGADATDATDAADEADAAGDLPGTDEGTGCPGGPLCDCTRALDCESGYCLDTMEGAACAPLCTSGETCPAGWSCRVMQTFPEEVRACVAPSLLCRPCRLDAECNGTGEAGNLCLPEGPDGSTCGRACTGDGDCPEGFACAEVAADPVVRQCRPAEGAPCPCTERFVGLGYQTTCFRQNEAGRCEATRTCDQACAAPDPAPEACGAPGVDEDCDGTVDEDGAAGCLDWYRDLDDDGYGASSLPARCLCVADPWTDYTAEAGGDCADLDPGTSPGLPEDCATPRDDNCRDGTNDPGAVGCQDLWPDRDQDGFGGGAPLCLCRAEGEVGTAVGGDCDDADPGAYPGLEDLCNGRDDDCDGFTDGGFPDLDGDAIADCVDGDRDGDGVDNPVDVCPDAADPDQSNVDGDGEGDACDTDDDGDGVPDGTDVCPVVEDTDQADGDGDGAGDACDCDADDDGVDNANPGCPAPDPADVCPGVADPDQADLDRDGLGDACDPDRDGDGVPDVLDGCPSDPDPTQADLDRDGEGDACDPDDDGDGIADGIDLCPAVADPGQGDIDGDLLGDACDPDRDGDGHLDDDDNCPGTPNVDQHDTDGNGVGDACEGDIDGDGVTNELDVCLLVPDPDQADQEGDGIGDACDCDRDGDGVANPNPGCPVPDPADVCPATMDPGQEDGDNDGEGDACDADRDGDGDPNVTDCAPGDPAVGHGMVEACNSVDDDCDGEIDEQDATGCTKYRIDADGDGYGATGSGRCLCAPSGSYTSPVTGDCDDRDQAIHPGATELCNGRDDDCDGQLNQPGTQGCTPFYRDGDGDGHGVAGESQCLCAAAAPWLSARSDDCDDGVAAVNPSQAETCLTAGVDDDCDGATDEEGATACATLYRDADGDGRGTSSSRCLCGAQPPFSATLSGDCDDGNGAVGPQAAERCATAGVDDDCDGDTDEAGADGCRARFQDSDRDAYGTTSRCLCAGEGTWTADLGGDCNDNNGSVHPGVPEACAPAGVDDDCDGVTDGEDASGCTTRYLDTDGDGWGVSPSRCLCAAEGFHTTTASPDCDDGDGGAHPGATEICGNTRDEDCDGQTDEPGCAGCVQYYRDEDGDTYGVVDAACLCQSGPSGTCRATRAGDCDDGRAAVNPGVSESCTTAGLDDNCNGSTDEQDAQGCTQRWRDVDGDQYGITGDGQCLCAAGPTYRALLDGDCNDGSAVVNPGAAESCLTAGVDDDCDGGTDEENASGCGARYHDGDADGYGVGSARCLCASLGTWRATQAGDCDDGAAAVHPGVAERCATATVDDDCDGLTDEENAEDCTTRYYDFDADAWGVTGNTKCLCAVQGKHSAPAGGDCADTDVAIHPEAPEACNGKDDDCDSATDEDFPLKGTACDGTDADLCLEGTWQCNGTTLACSDQTGANPETCNGLDEDCDGSTDEDFPGLGSACTVGLGQCLRSGTTVCRTDGSGTKCSVNPGTPTTETCNGLDDDCNGGTDEPFTQKGQPCDGPDGDACLEGTWNCDGVGLVCNDATGTQTELCNDVDDDCDGATDETFIGKGQPCDGTDSDECREGTFQCNGTVLVCTDNTGSTVETCNGLDDDCDGTTDEGFQPPPGATCEVGQGECLRIGSWVCNAEGVATVCSVTPGDPTAEVCNERDDDCNGVIDDPFVAKGSPCDGEDEDFCQEGIVVCDGLVEVCDDLTSTNEERCDTVDIDDDCDGETDEDGAADCYTWYLDADGDSWGKADDFRCACGRFFPYSSAAPGDCDDSRANVYPGAPAVCGRDADCNGAFLDPTEPCDDGNKVEWDGCYDCVVNEFLVNTVTAGGQDDPAFAALGGEAWIATWTDTDAGGNGTAVLAQAFREGGTKWGDPFVASDTDTKGHFESDVASRADGTFAVAWSSSVVISSEWFTQVRMRRFDDGGQPVDSVPLEIGEGLSDREEHSPVVVPLGADDWVAVWHSLVWEGPWTVKARRVTPAGGPGTLISISPEPTAGDWLYPSATPMAHGGFAVAMTGPYSRGTSVYLKGYDAIGREAFSRLVAGAQEVYIAQSDVKTLADGNLAVAWPSNHAVYGSMLWARRYAPDGTPVDALETLVTSAIGSKSGPRVFPLAGGDFVVAWSQGGVNGTDVRMVRMGGKPFGPVGSEVVAHTYTAGSQYVYAGGPLQDDKDRLVVLWSSPNQDGSDLGVFGQRFAPDLTRVWP